MRVRCDEGPRAVLISNRVNGHIVAISILVEHVSVAMRESTSLHILSRDSNVVTLFNKSGEGECLSRTPVDTGAIVDGLVTRLKDLGDLRVELARRWQYSDLVANLAQGTDIDTCVLQLTVLLRVLNLLPLLASPILCIKLEIL